MTTKITLICILIVSAIVRIYALGVFPHGLYSDEVSIGFNAWSIMTTGKDEAGVTYPLSFKAFGEYKLPVYIYGSIPFIALFGLNGFSVRLLSALAGVASTGGIYLLSKRIATKSTDKIARRIALISSALFALAPWSIHFSRGAFEANLALCFVIFGSYHFITYGKTNAKPYQLILAIMYFILALYTYNAERIFLPLFITILTMFYSKSLFKTESRLLPILSLGTVLVAILFSLLGSIWGNESARAQQVVELGNRQYLLGPLLGFLQKYLTHFSSDFLFFSGDIIARHSVRELGELFLPQLPFLLIGFYAMVKAKTKEIAIVLIWLVLAPIPAALATPVPHALRSLLLLVPLTIATAWGIEKSLALIRTKIPRTALPLSVSFFTIIFVYSLVTYMHVYYKHYIYKSSWDWDENKTILAETLANDYPNAQRIQIEADPFTLTYIKFFNATHNRATDDSRYIFYTDQSSFKPQSGDIVAINGWKGTPEQLSNVKELNMLNNSIGFKVGEWKE